jgi:hypothetical protein
MKGQKDQHKKRQIDKKTNRQTDKKTKKQKNKRTKKMDKPNPTFIFALTQYSSSENFYMKKG